MKISEAQWFNESTKEKLAKAQGLKEQADKIRDQIEYLVEDFAKQVMLQISLTEPSEKSDVQEMIRMLPNCCFHRTELQVAFNEKFGRPGIAR